MPLPRLLVTVTVTVTVTVIRAMVTGTAMGEMATVLPPPGDGGDGGDGDGGPGPAGDGGGPPGDGKTINCCLYISASSQLHYTFSTQDKVLSFTLIK